MGEAAGLGGSEVCPAGRAGGIRRNGGPVVIYLVSREDSGSLLKKEDLK